jgi:hypothetical protein
MNGKIYWFSQRAHLKGIDDDGTLVDVKPIAPHDSWANPIVDMRCARPRDL